MWLHVRNKLLIGDDGCLFQSVHAFVGIDVDISIFGNKYFDLIKCYNIWWEIFRVDSHIICS